MVIGVKGFWIVKAVSSPQSVALTILSTIFKSAKEHPYLRLNPDSISGNILYLSKWKFSWCAIIFSQTFERTGKILIGRKSENSFTWSTFGIGLTLDTFHKPGKVPISIITIYNVPYTYNEPGKDRRTESFPNSVHQRPTTKKSQSSKHVQHLHQLSH